MVPVIRFLLACLILPALLPAIAVAQSAPCGQAREVGARALEEATWNQLNSIYELVGAERYDEAHKELQSMLGGARRDNYLQAVLEQALAQVEWSRENYDSALSHFEKAIELDTLPNEAHFALMYQIAQLYFMKELNEDALARLELWFCTAPKARITAAAYLLKASIYAQMKDYRQALPAIEQAIAIEAEPKESWYQLKLASHYELEQYPRAAETLEIMITLWPDKKIYWMQLAQIYFNLKQVDKSLAVAVLAYRKKFMTTQDDLVFLSKLYASTGVPVKAAEVLQQGIIDGVVESTSKYWTMVADSWYAAAEMDNSLAAYEKAGATGSNGELDLRRAYILVDLERWIPAREALYLSLEKGGLDERKTGEVYLLRGMAEFNLENYDQASSDWGKASRYPPTRDAAQQWMNHLQQERERRVP